MNRRNGEAKRTRSAKSVVCRAAYYLLLTGGMIALAYAGFVMVERRDIRRARMRRSRRPWPRTFALAPAKRRVQWPTAARWANWRLRASE